MLDLRNHNPCSRIPRSKAKTLSRYRHSVSQEVRARKEYKDQRSKGLNIGGYGQNSVNNSELQPVLWRRCISSVEADTLRCEITDETPTIIDWSSLKPKNVVKTSQLNKATDSSARQQIKKSESASNNTSSNNSSASRLATNRFQQTYSRSGSAGDVPGLPCDPVPVESISNSRLPTERDITCARLSAGQNSKGGSYSERTSSQAADPRDRERGQGKAISGYIAPANIDLLPIPRPGGTHESKSGIMAKEKNLADASEPHAHPSSGKGGASASASGAAAAAGSIVLNIGEPVSPGAKDRRSNRAPRDRGRKNSSGSTKSSNNTSLPGPYVKAHPLTSAYYGKDGGGTSSAGTRIGSGNSRIPRSGGRGILKEI